MSDALQRAVAFWLGEVSPDPQRLCPSRDVFQARLDRLLGDLSRARFPAADAALLVAVAGEIGNNSFDHNLGRWQDVAGCWLDVDIAPRGVLVALADRGQGIFSSLNHINPDIQTEQQAVETAFSKTLSGRFPERRGNGLKFVRSVINAHPDRGLMCQSGTGKASCGGLVRVLEKDYEKITRGRTARGTITAVVWDRRSREGPP